MIKKYLKHETIWRQNVPLEQKVMLVFREAIERASPTRDEQTDVNIKNPASVCILPLHYILEDQHMEWKPAGQPEHASLKQCQLIVANRCSGHPQQVVEIRFLCNVIDAGALIGPCSHVTSCCCLIC